MSQRRQFRSVVVVILVVVAVMSMVSLGFWQLDRMHQKEQRLASIAQKSSEGVMSLTQLDPTKEDIRDYEVAFDGRADTSQVMFLDNRVEKGRVGYDVLVPVQSAQGTVLVNFGWILAPPTREQLPAVALDNHVRRYHGRIMIPAHNPVVRETLSEDAHFPVVVQAIDVDFIRRLTGQSLLPYVVTLTEPGSGSYVRQWTPVVMPPKKHFGYAIQWFGLALAAMIISLVSLSAGKKG